MQVVSARKNDGISRYEARVASELDIYRNCVDVHNLPPVFHYWSNRHIRPLVEPHGFTDPASMFLLALEKQCAGHREAPVRFLSAGSGNCDLEVELAVGLRAKGYENFIIECLDLNPAMLNRGADRARKRGVAANLEFAAADLNCWVAQREYNAVMADQSLHHVMDLESLFGQIRRSLLSDGTFVISDMIGRNGHLRWPAALTIVREFWKKLPPSYRRNCRSGRYEAVFEDADCSTESFEGIRAQDILGLLSETFCFRFFLGFGNLIDPFIDRSFGPHFDPGNAWDRDFIDRVHRRDEEEMAAGRIHPTHMLAILGTQPGAPPVFCPFAPPRIIAPLDASFVSAAGQPRSGYEWESWPHVAEAQLQCACRIAEDAEARISKLEAELNAAIASAQQHEIEFQNRTEWALHLDQQLKAVSLLLAEQDEELERRTAWARKLEAELNTRTAWALQLDHELKERTEWALRLDRELADRTRDLEQCGYLRAQWRLAKRLLRSLGATRPTGCGDLSKDIASRIRHAGRARTKATG